jgi:TPR repeat protein
MVFEPRRVVLVWAGRATGRSGSGYLLTPHLVLTARHVVLAVLEPESADSARDSGDRVLSREPLCTVRPLPFTETAGDYDYAAEVEWSAEDLDVALLRIVDARWSTGAVRDGWWAPITGTNEVPVSGVGFPRFQRDDTEQLVARLRPLSGLIRQRLELMVDDPPAATDGKASPWAGISGAAVFAGDMLVGVVLSDPAGTDHHRLRAVPASLFAENPDFVRTVVQDGGPSALRRSLLQRREISDLLELGLTAEGRLPTLAEVDPYVLRLTESVYGSRDHRDDPYVPRDCDAALRAGLERSGFVLLIGPSKAGKSRTAFEVALATLPDAVLIVPSPGRRALQELARGELLDIVAPDRPVVVWLDDLERYLDPSEGFDGGHLSALTGRSPRLVVVATLRTDQYSVLARQGAEEIDKTARQILAAAEQVRMELALSEPEREAAASAYPNEDFSEGVGIGERLVSAPLLLEKFVAAFDSRPIRWCLVMAAVDWKRIGMQQGIPEPELRRLTAEYLADQAPNLDLTDENYLDGKAWALAPIAGGRGRIGLLSRDLHADPPVFEAFDYIVASVDGQDPALDTPVSQRAWEAGEQGAGAVQRPGLAYAAYARGITDVAERVWQSLAEAGDPESANRLGVLLAQQGRISEAERWYRQAVDAGYPGAMNNLANLFYRRRPEEAERWYRLAAENGITVAMANLAQLLDLRGPAYADEAEEFLRKAAQAGDRNSLGNLCAKLHSEGRLGELAQEYLILAQAGDVLAMRNLGMAYSFDGRHEDAERWTRRAADAGLPDAMFDLAVRREHQGQPQEAELWYGQAANRGRVDAMARLGQLLAARGRTHEAERWLRQAANLGNVDSAAALGALLLSQGHLQAAEPWYRFAASEGNDVALFSLAQLVDAQGRTGEAETLYRQIADEDFMIERMLEAMYRLSELLAARGAIGEARQWQRKARDLADEYGDDSEESP